jgi:hypothetical protein
VKQLPTDPKDIMMLVLVGTMMLVTAVYIVRALWMTWLTVIGLT